MFRDPPKMMKLQPMELPADPGLSEVSMALHMYTSLCYNNFQQKFKVLLLRRLSRELVCCVVHMQGMMLVVLH